MNAVIEFLFPSTDAGIVWGLVFLAVGIMVQGWFLMRRDERRDAKAQSFDAAAAEAIAVNVPIEVMEPTRAIPFQRVTNGEDLLGGGLR